jgi:hypothetical protein
MLFSHVLAKVINEFSSLWFIQWSSKNGHTGQKSPLTVITTALIDIGMR